MQMIELKICWNGTSKIDGSVVIIYFASKNAQMQNNIFVCVVFFRIVYRL